jgi:hypothetical protein
MFAGEQNQLSPLAASNTEPNNPSQSSTLRLSSWIVASIKPEATGTAQQMTDSDSDDHQQQA